MPGQGRQFLFERPGVEVRINEMYVFAVPRLVPDDERPHQRTNLIQLLHGCWNLNDGGHESLGVNLRESS